MSKIKTISSITNMAGGLPSAGGGSAVDFFRSQVSLAEVGNTPLNGAVGTSRTSSLVINFNYPVNKHATFALIKVIGSAPVTITGATWSNNSKTVTLAHGTLEAETQYRLTYAVTTQNSPVESVTGNFTFTTIDTAPPTLLSSVPANAATTAETDTNSADGHPIVLTFDDAMEPTTFVYTFGIKDGAAKTSAITWAQKVATIVTTAKLVTDEDYELVITEGFDTSGNELAGLPITIDFTTEAAPTIVSFNLDGHIGEPTNSAFVFTFDRAMAPGDFNLTCTPDALVLPTAVWNNPDFTVVTINHTPMICAHTYNPVVAAKDVHGNGIVQPAAAFTLTTEAAPTLTSVVPVNNIHGISIDTENIVFTFAQAMQPLRCAVTHGLPDEHATATWSDANRVLTINCDTKLAINTTYTVTVIGADGATHPVDAHGNEMAGNAQTVFYTEATDIPTVAGYAPTADQTIADLTAAVTITFSEYMATNSVVFSCTKHGGAAVTLDAPSWSNTNQTVTFTHLATAFDDHAQYDCALTDATDNNGKHIAGLTGWHFHTDATP